MILQDNEGNNKIFIDDNLGEFNLVKDNNYNLYYLTKNNYNEFTVKFVIEDIELSFISSMSISDDHICTSNDFIKNIKDDEMISVEIVDGEIIITTMKLPEFIDDGKYPKFEINISECTYSMRIYNNDHEYLDIPKFQSHYSIYDTLEYIKQLVFYVTLGRPDFIKQLCEYNSMDLFIYDASHEKVLSGGEVKYKLGEEGLYLTGGELDNFLVEWNKFFKLVMDETWEVDFIDDIQITNESNNHKCSNCANYTEPDEVDNGCYMCCKGLEDNYVPIEKE